MLAPWVIDEMKEADLHDKRLDKRLNRILSDLAEHPTASIPAACGGNAETVAAYRFFDKDKVDPQDILDPHFTRTRQRIAAQKVAIFVPDTTEIDLTRPQQQVVGTGPLDDGSRRGVLLHPIGAFSEDATPLGTIWTAMGTRTDADASQPKRDYKKLPIEEKESYRWLESLRRVRAVAEDVPGTQCILVADSESDIYEVLAEPRGSAHPIDWIIRACQDRATVPAEEETAGPLRAAVSGTEVLFTQEITVRAHRPKTACEERKRRGVLPSAQVGLSCGSAAVRARGSGTELRGGGGGRGVARADGVSSGSELPGPGLRGDLRAVGVEVGVRGRASNRPAEATATSGGDDSSDRPTGRLRQQAAAQGPTGPANTVAGDAADI
jgi:hypothetical protein